MAAPPSRKKIAAAARKLWEMPEGRLLLSHLIERSGVVSPFMQAGPDGLPYAVTDPVGLAICEGERRMGLEIANLINSKPSDFVAMQKQIRDVFEGTEAYQ